MIHPCEPTTRVLGFPGYDLLVLGVSVLLTGCAAGRRETAPTRPGQAEEASAIRLPLLPHANASSAPGVRRFVCVVTGRGRAPDTGSRTDRRNAAMQAAIIDALHRAFRAGGALESEAHGSRLMTLSDRLTLRSADDGTRIVLRYENRGRSHRAEVVDGRLTHPPLRRGLLSRFLAEVNDRVRLVSTEPCNEPGRWVATMACYEQAAATSRPVRTSQPTTTPGPNK